MNSPDDLTEAELFHLASLPVEPVKRAYLRVKCVAAFNNSPDHIFPCGRPKVGSIYIVTHENNEAKHPGYYLLGYPAIEKASNKDVGYLKTGFEVMGLV
jgi:hypothetical protein